VNRAGDVNMPVRPEVPCRQTSRSAHGLMHQRIMALLMILTVCLLVYAAFGN
jgi:hypothetical protein